jgi:hypothetical protein
VIGRRATVSILANVHYPIQGWSYHPSHRRVAPSPLLCDTRTNDILPAVKILARLTLNLSMSVDRALLDASRKGR